MFTPSQKSCPELESASKKVQCVNAKTEREFFWVQSITQNKLRNTNIFFLRQLPHPGKAVWWLRAQTFEPDSLVSTPAHLLLSEWPWLISQWLVFFFSSSLPTSFLLSPFLPSFFPVWGYLKALYLIILWWVLMSFCMKSCEDTQNIPFSLCITRTQITPTHSLKEESSFMFTISEGLEFRSSLAGWFWLKTSHEVGVRCLLRLRSSKGPTALESPLPLTCLASWHGLLAGDLSASLHEPLHGIAWVSSQHDCQLPLEWVIQETKVELQWRVRPRLGSHTLLLLLYSTLTQEEGTAQWHDYQEVTISRGHLGGWLPHPLGRDCFYGYGTVKYRIF